MYFSTKGRFSSIAAALICMASVAQAQFQFKDTYPTIRSIPAIKPEWRDLIANASITNAPIRTRTPDGSMYIIENRFEQKDKLLIYVHKP